VTGLPLAVLFDWDNTLVDNWGSIGAALNAALADAGRAPFSQDEVMDQARLSARDSFPQIFGPEWPRAREVFYAHFAANHLAGLKILRGAEALLDLLAAEGVPLALVSNKKGDLLRREVAHLGWTTRFVKTVGALDAAADKPDAAPVHLALAGSGIEAGPDVWMVGDTDIDMRAARAAGCSGVLVGPGPADPALLAGAEPALKFRDCVDFAGFVRSRAYTISF
jgi:phosphoglycolate phosphatase